MLFNIGPGNEWYVPVHLACAKSSLYVRLDERAEWFLALDSMDTMILQGNEQQQPCVRTHTYLRMGNLFIYLSYYHSILRQLSLHHVQNYLNFFVLCYSYFLLHV